MRRIIAFDLARLSGAAWRDCAGSLRVEHTCLGRKGNLDEHLLTLRDWAQNLARDSGANVFAVENDVGRGKGSRTLQAYHSIVRLAAAEAGAQFVYDLNAMKSRKLALGAGLRDKARAQAVARAEFNIPLDATEDEVDAVILLDATQVLLDQRDRVVVAKRCRRRRKEAA